MLVAFHSMFHLWVSLGDLPNTVHHRDKTTNEPLVEAVKLEEILAPVEMYSVKGFIRQHLEILPTSN